ncbi:hypothetical protein CR513_50583, partial [Mucuna pruriens]
MVVSNGHFPTNLPILDGKNYEKWCIQMRVMDIVKYGFGRQSNLRTKVNLLRGKEKGLQGNVPDHHCVDSANFEKITSTTSAKEACDILDKSKQVKEIHIRLSRDNKSLLQIDNHGSTIVEYFNCSCSYKLDKVRMEKILGASVLRFDHIAVAIEESNNLELCMLN